MRQLSFIVIGGTCTLQERQVHHLEGRTGSDDRRRMVHCRNGRAFGHYPLVHNEPRYDYAAFVEDMEDGCCVLLVPKTAYVQALRKVVENQMRHTVSLLQANKTFSAWSVYALNRIYFWFTHRRYSPGRISYSRAILPTSVL